MLEHNTETIHTNIKLVNVSHSKEDKNAGIMDDITATAITLR